VAEAEARLFERMAQARAQVARERCRGVDDPVLALIAEAGRLEVLWIAADGKGHDRQAKVLDEQMGAILNQLRNRNITPITLAGAVAMLEEGLRGGCIDDGLINAAIAGLRDMMQPEASPMSAAQNDEPGTAEALAALEFEPVGPEVLERFDGPAWHNECLDHGITLRLASVLAVQTKPEMIDVLRSMLAEDGGMDAFDEATRVFQSTADLFESFATLLRAVGIRQMVAVANLELEFDREAEESKTKREVETGSIGFGEPEEGDAA
jgi:hypothetical protein